MLEATLTSSRTLCRPDKTQEIELTNRCNAQCHFCPRPVTPKMGFMSLDTFEQAIKRSVEADVDEILMTGQGESLIHPNVEQYVRYAVKAGLKVSITTNGSLFNNKNTQEMHKWGVHSVNISMSDFGEAYEEVYKLPFKETMNKIQKFIKYNRGRLGLTVNIVNHGNNSPPIPLQEKVWRRLGVNVHVIGVSSRASSQKQKNIPMAFLNNDMYRTEAQYIVNNMAQYPVCIMPMVLPQIEWQGRWLLCCNDYESKMPLGDVFTHSKKEIDDIVVGLLAQRNPLCDKCEIDPVNRLRNIMIVDPDALESTVEDLYQTTLHQRAVPRVRKFMDRIEAAAKNHIVIQDIT